MIMKFIIVVFLQVPIVPGVVSTVIPGVRCVFVLVLLRLGRRTRDQGPIHSNLSTFKTTCFLHELAVCPH